MTRHSLQGCLAAALVMSGVLWLAAARAQADPAKYTMYPASASATAQSPTEEQNVDACWRHNVIGLEQHAIGFTLHRPGLRPLDTVIPMHPIGVQARHYTHYPALSYALGGATEVAFGVMGAKLDGTSAEPIFYGLGIQKQLNGDPCAGRGSWSVSVGGYGYAGNRYSGGAAYVSGTTLLSGTPDRTGVLYGHLGLELETFSNHTSDTGVRPYLGASWVAIRHGLTLNAEVAPKQSWERTTPWAVIAAVPVYTYFSISFGIRSDGFQTFFTGPF